MDFSNTELIILRSGNFYRASIDSLSSLFLTKQQKESYLKELDALNESLNDLNAFFDETLCSKSEMKASYTSKNSTEAIKNNGTYLLTADVTKITSNLKKNSEIESVWGNSLEKTVEQTFKDAFNAIEEDTIALRE